MDGTSIHSRDQHALECFFQIEPSEARLIMIDFKSNLFQLLLCNNKTFDPKISAKLVNDCKNIQEIFYSKINF